MARKAKVTLTRIVADENSQFATLSREQLLMHGDQRGAADELYRRAFNKMVKKNEAQ